MVSVVDGVASDSVSGLGVGEYVVVARYGENGVYCGGVGVGSLVVEKLDVRISGFRDYTTKVGNAGKFTISADVVDEFSADVVTDGEFRCVINNETYYGVLNGHRIKWSVQVPTSSAGVYWYTLEFEGDDIYNSVTYSNAGYIQVRADTPIS